MNPLGVHALVFVPGWTEPEARHAIAAASRCEFDLIEIPLLDPAEVDPAMTRRLLDDHGLDATCSLGLSFDNDISSEDLGVVERGKELLTRAVEVTAAIGASYLGGITYSAMGKYLKPSSAAGRANAAAVLQSVCRLAAQAGVTVGMEPVNRYESNLINTAAEALALADEVGADNLVVHLDTYHMHIEEGGMGHPVHECGSRLGYVHVGESHRGYLGSGSVDFNTLFRALTEVGYDGVITFESFSSRVVSPAFAAALAVWRNLWEDGEDLASHARRFILTQLEAAQRAHQAS